MDRPPASTRSKSSTAMASSSSSPQDHEPYSLRLFPAWKYEVWHKISADAHEKGSFSAADYDDRGLLKAQLQVYKKMFSWLERQSNALAFASYEPQWEYAGGTKWQLFLIDTDEWQDVRSFGKDKAVVVKKSAKKIPKLGGLFVDGLQPENGISDDVEVVEREDVPRPEDCPTWETR